MCSEWGGSTIYTEILWTLNEWIQSLHAILNIPSPLWDSTFEQSSVYSPLSAMHRNCYLIHSMWMSLFLKHLLKNKIQQILNIRDTNRKCWTCSVAAMESETPLTDYLLSFHQNWDMLELKLSLLCSILFPSSELLQNINPFHRS